MDLNDINEAVAKIDAAKEDDARAHVMEIELRAAFIRHVSTSAEETLAEMARAVLKTEEIKFGRWCE